MGGAPGGEEAHGCCVFSSPLGLLYIVGMGATLALLKGTKGGGG
jgi:hypothetical protein